MPGLVELRDLPDVFPGEPRARHRCAARRKPRDYVDIRDENPAISTTELLRKIRAAARDSDSEDGVELIYFELDTLLSKGLFSQVDELLARVDTTLPVLHLLAVTSITNAAKNSLQARSAFVARVREHLAREEPDRVEKLLAGLE